MLQRLHREGGVLQGPVQVDVGSGLAGALGRRLARKLGVPTAPGEHRLAVTIRSVDGVLHWDRRFDDGPVFASRFVPRGHHPDGCWEESTGAVRLVLRVAVEQGGWRWVHVASRLGALRLPAALQPRTEARKWVTPEGRYGFEVRVSLPPVGFLLGYRGTLNR